MIVEEIAEEMMYHISLSKTMIKHADYAILPGDPARVELIAKTLDPNSYPLASHREYTSYLSYVNGNAVVTQGHLIKKISDIWQIM